MHLNWQPAPGVTNPNEPWLYGVNDPAGEVLALLDPWVDPPPGADDAVIGRWRLVRYKLRDDSELLNALEEHPEAGDVPQELKLVIGSVLGQDPKSVQTLGCERVLELVGDAGRDWVAERTERALRQLLALIRVGEREEVLVSRGELAELWSARRCSTICLTIGSRAAGGSPTCTGWSRPSTTAAQGCLTRWTSSRPRLMSGRATCVTGWSSISPGRQMTPR